MRDIDYEAAKAAIADASTPVIVDMHADWCKFCKTTRPHLERISEERGDAMRIVGIDTDEHPDAFEGLGAKTLPTIILFVGGTEGARRGSGDYEGLTAWLAEHGV
jgi:thioredoxin 1